MTDRAPSKSMTARAAVILGYSLIILLGFAGSLSLGGCLGTCNGIRAQDWKRIVEFQKRTQMPDSVRTATKP